MTTNRLDPHQHPWLRDAGWLRIADAIAAKVGEARIVGGAVRDALLGRTVGDIDLACTLPPDQVIAALQDAAITVKPTGIAHGTVTAIINHKGYEITSLRRDIETDGRHARVVFTDDWREDAARRDLTFNALYVNRDGRLYDYFDGQQDLAAGHVRFIGNAEARIREDVLRILRFFRFYAWLGHGTPDADAVAACHTLAHLLPTLSIERVAREMLKLLASPNPVAAWQSMLDHAILTELLPEAQPSEPLQHLIDIEQTHHVNASPLARLLAVVGDDHAVQVGQHWKLSNKQVDYLMALVKIRHGFAMTEAAVKRAIYDEGAAVTQDALLLTVIDRHYDTESSEGKAIQSGIKQNWIASSSQPHRNDDLLIGSLLSLTQNWQRPVFPLSGQDILALGISAGPNVGAILKQVEAWWIDNDYKPARSECMTKAKAII